MTRQVRWFDAHMHVFDPRFPLWSNGGYLPAPFTLATYRQRVASLPTLPAGGVVVSASTQGFNQTYLRAALQELGRAWVGVTQLPASVPDATVLELHELGVRAIRCNLFRGGRNDLDGLARFARRLYNLVGWHVELYVDARDLDELAPLVVSLPRICIDHLGLSRAGLPALVRLAAEGSRVKASGFGRADFSAEEALRLIDDANPESLLFGTDLPCPRSPRPFADSDFELLGEVFDDQALDRVLYKNAVDFYRPATRVEGRGSFEGTS